MRQRRRRSVPPAPSGLSFTGVLMTLPLWLATLAFVLELFAPVPVFVVLKRRIGEG